MYTFVCPTSGKRERQWQCFPVHHCNHLVLFILTSVNCSIILYSNIFSNVYVIIIVLFEQSSLNTCTQEWKWPMNHPKVYEPTWFVHTWMIQFLIQLSMKVVTRWEKFWFHFKYCLPGFFKVTLFSQLAFCPRK